MAEQVSRVSCYCVWEQMYPSLSRVVDVSVGIEEGTNVNRLSSPQVSLYGPVERQFE